MSWWRPDAFDTSDPLNQKIWEESPGRQIGISPVGSPKDGMVGAAQALVGSPALPWVPDLVGRRWAEPGAAAVLVIGSSYADFFSPMAGRSGKMCLDDYRAARGPADFQAAFLRQVVSGDHAYYEKLAELLQCASIEPEDVVVTDLCRASFVRVEARRVNTLRTNSKENVLKANRKTLSAYIQANIDWHNARLDQVSFSVIVALGELANEEINLWIEERARSNASFEPPCILHAPHPGNWHRRPADAAEYLQQLRRRNLISAGARVSPPPLRRIDQNASTRRETIQRFADNVEQRPVAVTINGVGKTFQRLTFVRDLIDPLSPEQIFNVTTSDGVYSFTKEEFLKVFPNVVKSKSYREGGLYHFRPPTTPKARPFLLASQRETGRQDR